MNRFRGFSLIELMVVVVIVGILGAIAIPMYGDYVTRGRIPDATSGLAAKRVRIEQFFQDNRRYVGAPDCANDATTSRVFVFSCTAELVNNFTLQAAGTGSMAGFTYTINEAGARTTTFDAARTTQGWPPNGVTAGTPVNCWVTGKAGQC